MVIIEIILDKQKFNFSNQVEFESFAFIMYIFDIDLFVVSDANLLALALSNRK